MSREKKKKHGFRNFIFFCIIVAVVWYIGTFTLKTTDVYIETDKISNNITFVQLTDLHGACFGDGNKYLIGAIREAEPDFIVATGDMFTSGDDEGQTVAVDLLSQLSKDYKVYFVNGEHDNEDEYIEKLESADVDCLDYETRDITVGASTIRLYGITNVYYSETFDLNNEFAINTNMFNIMAAHITNFDAFEKFGIDLSICGDSHGGQIRLPYFGGLINRDILLPEKSDGEERYVKGLYEKNNSKLFVSSGLGNYPYPVRFLNRPEIAVIHLVSKNAQS